MADEDKKKVNEAGVQAAAKHEGGLSAPLNPHTGQQNPAWQNILASAAGAMGGNANPYMAELQKQQAAQQGALAQARQAQAQQHAAAAAAAPPAAAPPAPHPGPAPGGLAGNPMAPSGVQQMQQMGTQAGQQLTPEQLALQQQQLAVSDERLKTDIDRAGTDREFRRFFDSIRPEPTRARPSYDADSLAGRAMRRG